MKVYFVMMLCRQVQGEYIFLRAEKAFSEAAPCEAHLQKMKRDLVNSDGSPKIVRLSTPNGQADCICEVGPFELDIEGT